jgi:pimeloyl-ACP methyl ester carboxylesterase
MSTPIAEKLPPSNLVDVNGYRLHYLDWGGDGPPIIIAHATGFLGAVYRPIALALRSIGHVFTYDQRGHGDSQRPDLADISWDATADGLEGLLAVLGLHAVRAFGHSAGGTAVAAVAARRPDLIRQAMLVEPVIVDPGDPRERPNELYERTHKRKPGFSSLAAMRERLAGKPPYSTWDPAVFADYCEYGTRPGAEGGRLLKCEPVVEARFYQTARDFDGLSCILRCSIPTLIVFGGKSDSPGIEFGARITEDAPHRRVVVVPNGGHLVPMEQPALIAQMAVEFFARGQ